MKTKIFVLVLLAASVLYPQTANQVIKKLQNKFNSISDFTANFSQNYFSSQGQDQGKTAGKFSYKKKNKFIVELKNQLIVSDGQTVWNNDKRFNRVVISNLIDEPTSFSLERFVFDYPRLCVSKIVGADPASKGNEYLELTPKDQDLEFKYVKIWMSDDGMISRLEVMDRGDMRYAFQLTELKLNQELSDSRFTFEPPKGIKIIDLR